MRKKVLRGLRRRGLVMGGAAALCAFVWLGCLASGAFGAAYGAFSRAASGLLGVLFSFVPFSVAEWLLYAAAGAGSVTLALALARSFMRKNGWALLRWLSTAVFLSVMAAAAMFFVWAPNYILPGIDERMGLEAGEQPPEALYRTMDSLLGEIEDTYNKVPRYRPDGRQPGTHEYDPARGGAMDAGGFRGLRQDAVAAMRGLQGDYPGIFGGAPVAPPKYIIGSHALSFTRITGVYTPLTGEGNVNTTVTDAFMPHVMCHEMAHRLGAAPEQDANFAAFLACIGSESPSFRYSGALVSFLYCLNAVEDGEKWDDFWSRLPEGARRDILYNTSAWRRYSQPVGGINVGRVASAVNDRYLSAMQQPGGVKSYGRVVDLLIAYYEKKL